MFKFKFKFQKLARLGQTFHTRPHTLKYSRAAARQSDFNFTPLSRAAFEGLVFARMLLEGGTVIDAPHGNGKSPLHWAVHID
jgi:hypothetical protein